MTASRAPEPFELAWPHGRLQLRRSGAMLGPLVFLLPGGGHCAPLYLAPWTDEPQAAALPPMMQGLRGEWLCLPFGPATAPAGLPSGWTPRAPSGPWDHGHAAHHDWTLLDRGPMHLRLGITLPEDDPVARIERLVRVDPERPALEVSTSLFPRRDACVPLALHPTFAIPPGGLSLELGPLGGVHTYPVPPEPGISRLLPDRQAEHPGAVPSLDGPLDLRHLPLPRDTEELVQLRDCPSPIVLRRHADGVALQLDWDTAALPDVMLWISQRGRRHAPWQGRNLALGVEPCASCFDLSRVAEPPPTHPLAHRRGLPLRAGEVRHLRYTLSAAVQG